MKKILVTGNSHAGVIKQAVHATASEDHFPQFDFDYACYAAREVHKKYFTSDLFNVRDYEERLSFVDVSCEENGFINLHNYDVILLCGGPSIGILDLVFSIPRSFEERPISRHLVKTIVLEKINTIASLKTYMSDSTRFLWMCSPLPSLPEDFLQRVISSELQKYTARMYDLVSEIVDQHNVSNPPVEVVFPPRDVLDETLLGMSESFSSGGLRFNGCARVKDDADWHVRNHGNLSYGLRMIKVVSALLN